MSELPLLIASLGSEEAEALERASRVGAEQLVDLKWAPAQAGAHLLEVYTPTSNEPLRLLAEPLAGGEPDGPVPLRLYPWEETSAEVASTEHVAPDDLIGRSLAGGRFEILSLIGEGSIGAVYRARHTGLGIEVAVKVLHAAFERDAAFCERFYAEALALSRLDHPNLVHVYDFGQEPDGLLYLSMAFVDGKTLRSIMRWERQLDPVRAVHLLLQVSAGLGHAHSRGLIHRDVKPDNVLITRGDNDDGDHVETVKLLDFGFAIPPSVSGEIAQRLAGTPVYMAPEQIRGEELDERSDIYACGIMLYELLAGAPPFLARDAATLRQMHIALPPPSLREKRPDVDPRFERLILRALSKRREDRHPNMRELRAELKRLLLPEGREVMVSAPPPSIPSEREALGQVAALVLARGEGHQAALSILAAAGTNGARALYEARNRIVPDQPVRIAFVTAMKSLGFPGLVVARAALDRLLEQPAEDPALATLAEDVLLGVPAIADEAAGHLIAQFAASPVTHVCRAAARALPRVWSERAAPALRQLLWHDSDDVRIAALVGLREIDRVDTEVVATISALVDGGFASGPNLRLAMRTALEVTRVRDEASALLARLT